MHGHGNPEYLSTMECALSEIIDNPDNFSSKQDIISKLNGVNTATDCEEYFAEAFCEGNIASVNVYFKLK